MNPEYTSALERQLAWSRFHARYGERVWREAEKSAHEKGNILTTNGRPVPRLSEMMAVGHGHTSMIIERGDCYYLAPNIQRLAHTAARTLPEVTFDLTMLPSKYGFLVLGEPLELAREITDANRDALRERGLKIPGEMWANVIGWDSSTNAIDGSGREATGAAEFMFFADYRDADGEPVNPALPDGYWPQTYFGVANGETWREKQRQYEHKVLSPAGETMATDRPHEVAFIFSLLLLMNQRILGARVERADRGQRRRSALAGRPEHHCKVITLRRYAEGRDSDLPPMEHDVEWSCQWLVRGHWRQQWYPSLAKHQPIWIEPFTKGPEGAPFKDDDARRIFGVVR